MKSRDFAKEVMAITPYIHGEFFRRQPRVLMKGKISLPQMVMLDFLNIKKECKMSDISSVMGVTKSAVTGIADRMIRLNLVKRARLKDDRRVVKIRLTPRGRSLAHTLYTYKLKMIDRLFSMVSENERLQYVTILKKVRDAIIAEKT